MTTIPVVWASNHFPETPDRGYWDQGMVEALFDHSLWQVPGGFDFTHHDGFEALPPAADGAVVVLPARHHASYEDVAWLESNLDALGWVLLILTGDEEHVFPLAHLSHPWMRVWVQTPELPPAVAGYDRAVGDGWPPRCPEILAGFPTAKARTWFFAGQITHDEREACAAVLRRRAEERLDGWPLFTKGFTLGLDYRTYLYGLASAKVAPCPGGPQTPDTFRLFEALEAGCVPVVLDDPYWSALWPAGIPFPAVKSWEDFDGACDAVLADWPHSANVCQAWWQGYKRDLAYGLDEDLRTLTGAAPERPDVADKVTVVMPTSVVASHPSTEGIEATIASIREQPGLEEAEIIVMADGLTLDQEDRRRDYCLYVNRLLTLCSRQWRNVLPILFDSHHHQSGMLRATLEKVTTPLVLFVEHDTPLCGTIDWPGLCRVVESGTANVVRLNHEHHVLEPHRWLALDQAPRDVAGVPMIRTAQWSSRPHLASTAWYRQTMRSFFGSESRAFIEDTMHGVLDHHWREEGEAGWEKFSLFLYAPAEDGSGLGQRRSGHSDLRGGQPKAECVWRYDTDEVPPGAPNPQRDEVSA